MSSAVLQLVAEQAIPERGLKLECRAAGEPDKESRVAEQAIPERGLKLIEQLEEPNVAMGRRASNSRKGFETKKGATQHSSN